jgi:hypothetical protein
MTIPLYIFLNRESTFCDLPLVDVYQAALNPIELNPVSQTDPIIYLLTTLAVIGRPHVGSAPLTGPAAVVGEAEPYLAEDKYETTRLLIHMRAPGWTIGMQCDATSCLMLMLKWFLVFFFFFLFFFFFFFGSKTRTQQFVFDIYWAMTLSLPARY